MNHWRILTMFLMVLVFVAMTPTFGEAQMGYGMHHGMYGGYGNGQGGGWNYCPYCGGNFRQRGGYGMMPYGGYGGMGPGMMGPGYDRPYGDSRDGRHGRYREPLEQDEARNIVEDMLRRSRNPNLKVGNIEDEDNLYVVDILTKDDSLVDKIEVDKETGLMRSAY
jgi:hypothetical protein